MKIGLIPRKHSYTFQIHPPKTTSLPLRIYGSTNRSYDLHCRTPYTACDAHNNCVGFPRYIHPPPSRLRGSVLVVMILVPVLRDLLVEGVQHESRACISFVILVQFQPQPPANHSSEEMQRMKRQETSVSPAIFTRIQPSTLQLMVSYQDDNNAIGSETEK